jgi:hypothetical protein
VLLFPRMCSSLTSFLLSESMLGCVLVQILVDFITD